MIETAVTDVAARRRRSMGAPRWVLAIALGVACVGLSVEFATGVPGPTVPPGPIILGVAALLVAGVRWRWMPVLGLLVALFLTVGAVASGATPPLLVAPGAVGPFVGSWLQVVGQIVAIVAGVVAVIAAMRAPRVRHGH